MRVFLLPALLSLAMAGCATRSLPPFEPPLGRADVVKVRTTAYTHSERDHRRHGSATALGTPLRSGEVSSAAADWARWPAGTLFRVLATGELYRVDDYGWALAGTNTIDLYKPTVRAMNDWAVRRVTIQILEWGDDAVSRRILASRASYPHVKRMLREMEGRQ